MKKISTLILLCSATLLTSCAYNPFISNNHTTGSAVGTAIGAGIGAGGVALLHGSKTLMTLAGLGGGALGYYMTTLRFDAGPIVAVGGEVYMIGDYMGIDIPSDSLFEPDTADFLPETLPILASIVKVLSRHPDNNIIISGNTSGFGHDRWEQKLSEKRAENISAYLWTAGINQFKCNSNYSRKLTYVGYGDYFPIAHHYTNKSIRKNDRIQITSYPTDADLHLDKRHVAMNNIGADD